MSLIKLKHKMSPSKISTYKVKTDDILQHFQSKLFKSVSALN